MQCTDQLLVYKEPLTMQMSLFCRMSLTAGSPQSVWISAAISCPSSNQSLKKMTRGKLKICLNLLSTYQLVLQGFDYFVMCFFFRLVYLFAWDPHRDVTYTVHRDSQFNILPDWYVEEIMGRSSKHWLQTRHLYPMHTYRNVVLSIWMV